MQRFSRHIFKKTIATTLSLSLLLSAGAAGAVVLDPELSDSSTQVVLSAADTPIVQQAAVTKVTARETNDDVKLDGAPVQPEVYKINGENYFKLRDIAYLLRNTDYKFNVGWNASTATIALTSGKAYQTVGGEMGYSGGGSAVKSNAKITLDGKSIQMTAYNIGGNNYFRLRDIGDKIGFSVDYSVAEGTVLIETGKEEILYTVQFNMNGHGTQIEALTGVPSGSTISSPVSTASDGYTLAGWYQDSACTKAWNFNSDTVTGDITLYAKWTIAYSVTFEMNGHGTQVETLKNVQSGSLITQPTPTAEGYTFEGWYAEQGCYTKWDFSKDRVGSDMVLYAKWTQNTPTTPETPTTPTTPETPTMPTTPTTPTTPSTDNSNTSTASGRNDGILTILVDAGHGGADNGTSSAEAGVYEKDLSLKVALKLQSLLQNSGVNVIMTRTTDESWTGSSRKVFVENNANVLDLVVCIHFNSYNKTARGCEMLIPTSAQDSTMQSKAIAQAFLSEFLKLGVSNRGIKEQNLFMGRAAVAAGVPIAYSEFCFIDNPDDYYSFTSTDEQLQKIAQAMHTAIMGYYQTHTY